MSSSELHPVLGTAYEDPKYDSMTTLYVAMGCFWGVERIFWKIPGVVLTQVGYQGGTSQNPKYVSVCSGTTGHAECVRIVYDRALISDQELLKVFWENHDPTQKDGQGPDRGSQYRSMIITSDNAQFQAAQATKTAFGQVLERAGHGPIVTEILPLAQAGKFWPAEEYHQGYLHKNPDGYCVHGPNGYTCPTGLI